MNCCEAEAFVAGTVDGDIIEEDSLQLLDSPWCEQNPREERVEQEDKGVCDSCGDG